MYKEEKIRSRKHMAFISGLPCVKCRVGPCDAHHIRIGTNGGMSTKPSDEWCVSLCRAHHSELHAKGERTFWSGFDAGVDGAKKLARGLYKVTGDNIAGLELIARFR